MNYGRKGFFQKFEVQSSHNILAVQTFTVKFRKSTFSIVSFRFRAATSLIFSDLQTILSKILSAGFLPYVLPTFAPGWFVLHNPADLHRFKIPPLQSCNKTDGLVFWIPYATDNQQIQTSQTIRTTLIKVNFYPLILLLYASFHDWLWTRHR